MLKTFKIVQVDNLDREENEDVVETLNDIINLGLGGTGSKAFIYAVRQYPKHRQMITELKSKLDKALSELDDYKVNSRKVQEVISFFQNNDKSDKKAHS